MCCSARAQVCPPVPWGGGRVDRSLSSKSCPSGLAMQNACRALTAANCTLRSPSCSASCTMICVKHQLSTRIAHPGQTHAHDQGVQATQHTTLCRHAKLWCIAQIMQLGDQIHVPAVCLQYTCCTVIPIRQHASLHGSTLRYQHHAMLSSKHHNA